MSREERSDQAITNTRFHQLLYVLRIPPNYRVLLRKSLEECFPPDETEPIAREVFLIANGELSYDQATPGGKECYDSASRIVKAILDNPRHILQGVFSMPERDIQILKEELKKDFLPNLTDPFDKEAFLIQIKELSLDVASEGGKKRYIEILGYA